MPNCSISSNSIYNVICLHSVWMSNSSIWLIDKILSGAITPGQSGPGSNGNKGYSVFPKTPHITGALSSYCLVSFPGHSLGRSYPSAEMKSVYSTAPADRAEQYHHHNVALYARISLTLSLSLSLSHYSSQSSIAPSRSSRLDPVSF